MSTLNLYIGCMSIVDEVGRKIRAIRESKGFTQEEVEKRSKALGSPVSKSFISQLENGNTDVSLSFLHALARALEVSLPDLVNEKLTAGHIVSSAALDAFCEADKIRAAEKATLKELLDKELVSFSTANSWREHYRALKFSQARRPVLTELPRVAEKVPVYRIQKKRAGSAVKRNR